METIFIILIISILGPIIGSAIGIIKHPGELYIQNMLSFAAGVMLAISFLELIPEAIELSGVWLAVIGILIGTIIMYLLDKLIPHKHPEGCECETENEKLKRSSIYLIAGIFLHNIPEGIAIATGTIDHMTGAIGIALAIAIHNIPEGICTSAPYYYCTKKRLRAFLLSASTAIPIAVGFLIGYFIFKHLSFSILGIIISATAGLMIFISAHELIPTACRKEGSKWKHSTIFSLLLGVIFVMILGLL